ncbi:MAG TPA: mannose-6-phosphate isomerase, class I, partial [Desulfobacterales bacterium]|nr:mannose-6-phosphate isomerase, class I [Desulfobacterales bacterium]
MFSRVWPMKNPIQYYGWGSTTAIPQLLGMENPENKPMAELWMGAHPKAPSEVLVLGRWTKLPDLIQEAPEPILGKLVYERFGPELPFLFKVLAAQEPLSIQAHPNKAQAREGFLREEALGIPIDAQERNYRDQNHKPELLCALTRFEALKGFRPPAEIVELFKKVLPPRFSNWLEILQTSSTGIRDFFEALMRMDKDGLRRLLGSVAEMARQLEGSQREFQWVILLHKRYPTDPGVLSPLFLNLVILEPGEAIYLPAGELHAYLEGMGIEIMANSDNVLRGGLTNKHVDVDELVNVCKFRPTDPYKLRPKVTEMGEWIYETPAEEFQLSVVRVDNEVVSQNQGGFGAASIIICTEGQLWVKAKEQPDPVELSKGRSIFIPAVGHPYTIRGQGIVYKATVPHALREV